MLRGTVALLFVATALLWAQSCGRVLAHCDDPGGCKPPLFCHEPTGLCVRPDPQDAGDGGAAREDGGADGGSGGATDGGCRACGDGVACGAAADCASGVCEAGACKAPSCADSVKNSAETDVDCGGGTCGACPSEKACLAASDCASGVCAGGRCKVPSCSDAVKNGSEGDVDCGGSCAQKCADGKRCAAAGDCQSGMCQVGQCVAAGCADGLMNGDETDVDCGGSCGKCADRKACGKAQDCQSGICTNNACRPPTCIDEVKNGAEADVDCGGGICPACGSGKSCSVDVNCASTVCLNWKCQESSCTDGHLNSAETDVDCGGGTCGACPSEKACLAPSDCASGVCVGGKCKVPTCSDTVKNGSECDVDCGGSCTQKCADGKHCVAARDCQSGVCKVGQCVAAGPPAWLSWVPGTQTQIVAGDCSAPYALKVVDAFGNPTAFAVAPRLTIHSTPGGLTFDTAVDQCQASGPISFPPGVSVVGVQARGIKAATYQVSATTPELSTDVSAELVVVPAAPLLKASPPGPFTAKAGQCMDITFTRQDVFSNLIPAKGTGEALEFTPPAGVSVHTSLVDCQLEVGAKTSVWITAGASQLVWVRGTVATGDSVVLPATFGVGATSVSLKVTAGAADRLVFAAFPPSLTAGVCSGAVTLELRDAYGNPASSSASLAVELSASPVGGATFFGDVACLTAATSIPLSGATTSFSLRPSSGGPISVTVSSPELPGGSTSRQWNVK